MANGMTTFSPVFGRTPALIRLKRTVVKPKPTSPSGAGFASFSALSAICVSSPYFGEHDLNINPRIATDRRRRYHCAPPLENRLPWQGTSFASAFALRVTADTGEAKVQR